VNFNFENDAKNDSEDASYYSKLNKAFVTCVNSLDLENFKTILNELDQKAFDTDGIIDYKIVLKVMRIIALFCNEIEVSTKLKEDFSTYLQMFIAKVQPLYQNMIEVNMDALIELLSCQTKLLGAKYFILPSHIVITSLQVFYTISLQKLSEKQFFQITLTIAKDLNNILNRYSNKFKKIAAVVSQIVMNIIAANTNFSNQNTLTENKVEFILKSSQNLERLVAQLVPFKTQFSKLCPYMISEYVTAASTQAIHPAIKSTLSNTIYTLISMCDIHSISQLHVVLPTGPKELFKILYAEYEKYFKYSGKI